MALNGLTVTANGLATEKPFLPRVIEFVKAQALSGSQEAKAKARNEDDEPPEPEYFLYPPDRLRKLFGETSPRRVGRGLQNLGNTCYFNSVLQALTYAVPLQKYFLTKEHSTSCMAKQHGTVCTLCLFEQHVLSVFDAQKGAFKPLDLLRHLPQIARRFHSRGRQEDAHEFLIHFLDSCHKSFLKHATADASVSRSVQQTTVIGQLFGGHLRSQVLCKRCKHPSNTFDPYMDISLEVQNANTLEKALEGFTRSETLSGANKYMCKKCDQKVDATKRFSIHSTPPLLTFQLKRFDFFHGLRGKLKKHVKFPMSLDVARFTSHPERQARYRLYGVVVHCGQSAKSGHYIAFAKHNSTWHCFNDETVRTVGEPEVLKQEAPVRRV
ncbi:Usp36 [Symbiodinium pilosum]|uniref:Ubiquitin carboxyl-terminal hydrolase n=1 Tax=Symbiodinium pilosum TaxID=2952 RepID=A0A812WSH9_SYMPI|nr:Usp36 [Symbiodinium pilosum]